MPRPRRIPPLACARPDPVVAKDPHRGETAKAIAVIGEAQRGKVMRRALQEQETAGKA